jgi:hypothetical protein
VRDDKGEEVRAIAFYLPQFHPIPENDVWWGEGFTEWTNVRKAEPLFRGHYQPRLPSDLGYYDLRSVETRIAQADLARQYGISAFCYYHYWFNGRMLLERPFNEVLASGRPDFPFCLCWANENWTRRWDGLEHEILMGQRYDEYDARDHMEWLCRAFADPRYVRVNNRPLFLVYCAGRITGLREVVRRWRATAGERGFPDIYLCAVKSGHHDLADCETISAGFDALTDFQPDYRDFPETDNYRSRQFNKLLNGVIEMLHVDRIWPYRPIYARLSYRKIVESAVKKPTPREKVFPCVFPAWDNSPRKRVNATIIQNDDAVLYGAFLESACARVRDFGGEEQIVFINAWNEWAEGCHLEPDMRNGRRFLEATKRALEKTAPR